MFQNSLFIDLFNIAKRIEPINRARVVAALVRRNKILSVGVNSKNSSYLSRKFAKNAHAIYEHAEVAAIRNADRIGLERCTLLIVRAKMKEGRWYTGLAKPCSGCSKAIKHFGIKKIIYSLEGNDDRVCSFKGIY